MPLNPFQSGRPTCCLAGDRRTSDGSTVSSYSSADIGSCILCNVHYVLQEALALLREVWKYKYKSCQPYLIQVTVINEAYYGY
jgi:hypothetical protein